MERTTRDLTGLLLRVQEGASEAREEFLELVYRELHALAGAQLRGIRAHTLRPTALVHEAYLKLFGNEGCEWANRRHFFWAASRAMRDVIVERARRASALRRGGDRRRVELEDPSFGDNTPGLLVDLEAALLRLEQLDPVSAEVVTLRFFGGLTHQQVADVQGVSRATCERRWEFARAWLQRSLEPRA